MQIKNEDGEKTISQVLENPETDHSFKRRQSKLSGTNMLVNSSADLLSKNSDGEDFSTRIQSKSKDSFKIGNREFLRKASQSHQSSFAGTSANNNSRKNWMQMTNNLIDIDTGNQLPRTEVIIDPDREKAKPSHEFKSRKYQQDKKRNFNDWLKKQDVNLSTSDVSLLSDGTRESSKALTIKQR